MFIELFLGDPDGLLEVLIGQLRIDDFVAMLRQEGRFDAAGDRVPAVEEEDFHEDIVLLTTDAERPRHHSANSRLSG